MTETRSSLVLEIVTKLLIRHRDVVNNTQHGRVFPLFALSRIKCHVIIVGRQLVLDAVMQSIPLTGSGVIVGTGRSTCEIEALVDLRSCIVAACSDQPL